MNFNWKPLALFAGGILVGYLAFWFFQSPKAVPEPNLNPTTDKLSIVVGAVKDVSGNTIDLVNGWMIQTDSNTVIKLPSGAPGKLSDVKKGMIANANLNSPQSLGIVPASNIKSIMFAPISTSTSNNVSTGAPPPPGTPH